MPIFDDPGKTMRHIEQELLDEPKEDAEDPSPVNYAVDFDRTAFADEETDDDDACYVEDNRGKPKRKGAGTLLLALVELGVLAAAIWWWIRWRS